MSEYVCTTCGAQRPSSEMGTIDTRKGTRYYCHPSMSTGPTCYMRATWAMGGTLTWEAS